IIYLNAKLQESNDRFRISEERLSLALSASQVVGIWDWDVENNVIVADVKFAALYGIDEYRAKHGAPIEEYLRQVHPHDLPDVQAEFQRAIASLKKFSMEYRILQPDGSVRWVQAQGRCCRNPHGQVVRIPGVSIDITGERKAREALQETE